MSHAYVWCSRTRYICTKRRRRRRRGFCTLELFINPRRACAGGLRYLSCLSVCLSVLFFIFNAWNFEKPCVQKLRLEKANMHMSNYRSRRVLARFEYRAYSSRYLQAIAALHNVHAVMASITIYCRTAGNLRSLFHVPKAAQKANGGSGSAYDTSQRRQ